MGLPVYLLTLTLKIGFTCFPVSLLKTQCEGMVYFSASDFKSLCGVVVPCSPPIYAVAASQEEMEALVLQALSFKGNNMTGLYESVWGSRLECISHWNALLRVLQSKGLT